MNWNGPATARRDGVRRPLGKIVCVGRNFAAHAREMGVAPPAEPLLFLKPSTSLAHHGDRIAYPGFTSDLHHEVELVVRIGDRLRDAGEAEAAAAIDGYGVGIDLTARDVQAGAKASGSPWAVAKGFDGAAPVSELWELPGGRLPSPLRLRLSVDGTLRQDGSTAVMLLPVERLLAFISTRFTLLPGDLVFTGTPEGVGPIPRGARVEASVEPGPRLEIFVD